MVTSATRQRTISLEVGLHPPKPRWLGLTPLHAKDHDGTPVRRAIWKPTPKIFRKTYAKCSLAGSARVHDVPDFGLEHYKKSQSRNETEISDAKSVTASPSNQKTHGPLRICEQLNSQSSRVLCFTSIGVIFVK